MTSCARDFPDSRKSVEFSVLVTCYYEERSIDEFYRRLSATLREIDRSYEIIMVNDGSADGTWQRLREIFHEDPHVTAVLDLAKNAGQTAAITAALAESRGRAVVLLDSDLQLAPEELPLLVARYDEGADLVTGYRAKRKDSLLRIVPSLLANIIMRKASGTRIRDFGCTFKIYNGTVLHAFGYGPRHLFSTVEVASRICRITEVPVTHCPRRYGKSGWTFSKLMKYNMENMVNLSERPFQWIALICLMLAGMFTLRLAIEFFRPIHFLPVVTEGLVLNVVTISMLVTVGLLSLVGEFTIRSFVRLRNLPLYIVRAALRRERTDAHLSGRADDESPSPKTNQ